MVDGSHLRVDAAHRLAVVGVGFWGASWLQVVRGSRHWELAALVDTDEQALTQAASTAGIQPELCFTSLADAVGRTRIDAALIVVPPAAHLPVSLEALDCGLHCLIEKPFATTLEDARRIVNQADSAGKLVMVSQQYRNRAGARTVRRLLDADTIGRIGDAHVRFSSALAVRGFQHVMEEPLLQDMAIHHFDLIRGILGVEPIRVHATSYNPSWSDFAGSAAATVVLEADDGAVITYSGTLAPRGRPTGWDGVWDVFGEKGAIHWDGDNIVLRPNAPPIIARIHKKLGREWNGRPINATPLEEADRSGSLADFSAAIRYNRQPQTSGRDNLRSLALTVAAIESARRGAAVEIAEVLSAAD